MAFIASGQRLVDRRRVKPNRRFEALAARYADNAPGEKHKFLELATDGWYTLLFRVVFPGALLTVLAAVAIPQHQEWIEALRVVVVLAFLVPTVVAGLACSLGFFSIRRERRRLSHGRRRRGR